MPSGPLVQILFEMLIRGGLLHFSGELRQHVLRELTGGLLEQITHHGHEIHSELGC